MEKREFLELRHLPARLDSHQAAWLLGFEPEHIPILTKSGLLRPLGRPAQNGPKYFSSATIQELARDPKWLGKASDTLVGYWQARNEGKAKIQASDGCAQ